jgi:hypothetical protein
MPLFVKYILAWFPMVIIAILNGTLRQYTYGPLMNELTAHQVSTFTGIIFFGIYIYYLTKKWPLDSASKAIAVGMIWIIMTIMFEFGFGHYVIGHPWQKLLHDYNLFAGRLWILMLIWTGIAHLVFYKILNK